MKKIAIFIDWDNFRKELDKITKKTKTSITIFDYNKLSQLMKLIRSFVNNDEELYRIFIYTAHPLSYQDIEKELKNRKVEQKELDLLKANYKKNKKKFDNAFIKAKNFIDRIALEEYVALRKGILKIGNVCNGEVTINQKQVDMLIGLDIAQLSYEKRVDKIIVFSKDTDMKPAIKVARINGIHTIIATFEESSSEIPKELRTHIDTTRKKSFKEITSNIK